MYVLLTVTYFHDYLLTISHRKVPEVSKFFTESWVRRKKFNLSLKKKNKIEFSKDITLDNLPPFKAFIFETKVNQKPGKSKTLNIWARYIT